MTLSNRNNDKAKKMSNANHQISQKYAGSQAVEDYGREYDPYRDFLVTGRSSNLQRSSQLGQAGREWDKYWGATGSSTKAKGGSCFASLMILLLPLTLIRQAQNLRRNHAS